jgi:Ca2+-binding EF-hand superfamily protein
VLSLVSGLSASQEELETLQKEFMRLDKDKNGTLNRDELQEMTSRKLHNTYEIDWD